MSSSYSYISKQADAGQKASESMNNVLQNGLNSALVSIKNNDVVSRNNTYKPSLGKEAVFIDNVFILDELAGKTKKQEKGKADYLILEVIGYLRFV